MMRGFTQKLTAVLVLMTLCVALCASALAVDSTDPLEVVIWDNNQQAGLQTICDQFTEQTGIPVQVVVKSWDAYWTLLEAGAMGGDMPDVDVTINGDYVAEHLGQDAKKMDMRRYIL